MRIPFVKMSGAGNDFVLVDRTSAGGLEGFPDAGGLARAMCDRRKGVGADGILVLGPPAGADFTMHYFNADGSTGTLCGNGGRCAADHMMRRLGRDAVDFHTCGKVYHAERSGLGVRLTMDDPGPLRSEIHLVVDKNEFAGSFVDTGSPHLVIVMNGELPGTRQVFELGRELRYHPEFRPAGVNVNFIAVEGEDEIRIRTYERGVEDETLACGTGAVASAIVYASFNPREGQRAIGVLPLSGDKLVVRFHQQGSSFNRVSLEGPAEVTFTGSFETDES